MMHTLNKLLDLLFPPRTTELLVRTAATNTLPSAPGCYEGVFYCTDYTAPAVRATIQENKYHANRTAQKLLAALFTHWMYDKGIKDVCVIPIPLGAARLHSRGHNQVTSILKQTSYMYEENLLTRLVETVPQTSLNKQQRLRNIKKVFVCDVQAAASLSARTIILLDDVTTTGATLNEARATLAPHLPPHTTLICVALAH